ncbi:hypothetical protein CFB84_09505 [Burkholderia aenigmatica]|uniref:Uncharacterized protein n=1 Tax=Burkholderia aenigmatica TaxID=2015348 RepID=A0A228J3K6_9BURK|nr:hypothetical protein CFB84_09505 [Burkholderia aenigmatica]
MAAGTFIGPGDGRLVALSGAVFRTVRSWSVVAVGVSGQMEGIATGGRSGWLTLPHLTLISMQLIATRIRFRFGAWIN